jgi:tetratricopeptide (TPR) repeat protein
LTAEQSVKFNQGPVRIELALVPQFRHARSAFLGEGDLVLAVAILAMSVLAMQMEALFRINEAPPVSGQMTDPAVEYIVRLLAEDYAGEQNGRPGIGELETAFEEAAAKDVDSFFMPSGTITDLERMVGGDAEGDEVRVPDAEESGAGEFQPVPEDSMALNWALDDLGDKNSSREVTDQSFDDQQKAQNDAEDDAPLSPTEESLGWGFYDWYDARDARVDHTDIQENLEEARGRLAIDPDDPWALTQLGYYQYLAFDYEGCKDTYAKFIGLYASDASGYNNLALVYKRLGEYPKEEAHYRLALALDPQDSFVLNNLAVNLAHQGRFDEALEIMEKLAILQPQDPYSDLHRSKIAAAMGESGSALRFLELALQGMAKLDTLHHIEFRQDIRVDPAFDLIRQGEGFTGLLMQYYGEDALPLLAGDGGSSG